jgi:YVTN family beta-propeller protein
VRLPLRRLVIAAAAVTLLAATGEALAVDVSGRVGPALGITTNGRALEPAGRLTTLGLFPTGGALTPDGRFYWAVDAGHGANEVKVVDVGTGQVVQDLPLPGGSVGIDFSSDGTRAYVSGEKEGEQRASGPTKGNAGDVIHVFAVTPATGRGIELEPIKVARTPDPPADDARTKQLGTAKNAFPQGLDVSPDGRTLVVALNQADDVAIVDLAAPTPSVRHAEVGNYPYAAAIDPSGTTAYVTNEYDGTVSVVDLSTAVVRKTITGLGGPSGGTRGDTNAHPEGLAFDPVRERAYVAVTSRDHVAVIDTRAEAVERLVSVGRPEGLGTAPVSVAVSPGASTLFTANSGEDAVAAISLADRPAGSTPGRPGSPGGPGTDGRPGSPGDEGSEGQEGTAGARSRLAFRPRPVSSIARYRSARAAAVKRLRARVRGTASALRARALRRAYRVRVVRLRAALLEGARVTTCEGPSRKQDQAYGRAVLGALARRARGLRSAGRSRAKRRAVTRRYRREVAGAAARLPKLAPCPLGSPPVPGRPSTPATPGTDGTPGTPGEDTVPGTVTPARPAFSLIGRIPTAAYTSDVDVGGGRLVWLAGKGLGAGPNPGRISSSDQRPETASMRPSPPGEYVLNKLFGRAGVLPVPSDERIGALTPVADRQVRPVGGVGAPPAENPVPAPGAGPSKKIKHVFYVVRENRTYDQVFGSDPRGDGDPKLEVFDDNGKPAPVGGTTPNAHNLANRFGLMDHTYANSEVSIDGHVITGGAYAIDYVQKATPANYGGRDRVFDFGVFPVTFPPNFFLFDRAAESGVTFRNYGEFGNGSAPPMPGFPGTPATPDRPTYADVMANTDPAYNGNLQIGCLPNTGSDAATNAVKCTHDSGQQLTGARTTGDPKFQEPQSRFNTFKRNFKAQLADDGLPGNTVPAFNYMILPNDHTNGLEPGAYSPKALVADNDLALGQIVDLISHSEIWKESAIVVVEDDSQDGADSVDAHRMPAFVISPWSKGGVLSGRFDQYSFVRTIGLLLGLEPLALNDGLATPLYDAFKSGPLTPADLKPYEAEMPEQDLNEVNPAAGGSTPPGGPTLPTGPLPRASTARLSEAMPYEDLDLVPQSISDRIIWESVFGPRSTPPSPGPNASPAERARATGAMRVYRRGGDVEEWLESNTEEEEEEGEK